MDWREIAFADNQPCINLISLKPYGILRILDDQCCFPQVSPRCCGVLVWLTSCLSPSLCTQAWSRKWVLGPHHLQAPGVAKDGSPR